MDFVHLHVHTQYSLLDGAIRLEDLFQKSLDLGYPAVTMTDHGNMFGALRFYMEAKKRGLKPIVGCEVYVAPESRFVKEKGSYPYHLVLLARDEKGYRNLSHLVSSGFLEGFYGKPRVDKALLKEHSEGLIGLSACLSGEVASHLKTGNRDAALRAAREYQGLFEPDSFYLEIQKNGIVIQDRVNEEMANLSELTGIPLVGTNDCHYLNKGDHLAHEVLLCIQTSKLLSDPDRMKMDTDQLYFKSPQEMADQFRDFPGALENAGRIAERCNVHIQTGETLLPAYPAPPGMDTSQYLERVAREGLEKRLEVSRKRGDPLHDKAVYEERLAYEMSVISSMGFSDYYLIVWDFIRKAREMGVSVGPGRGSGAGSLVAYTVGITSIDPLRFDLLFERFLNPERVSMPDFDIDFCQRNRDKVIHYVTDFYGKDRVGQIITYSTINSKTAIRDVGRVLGVAYAETDRISKLFPDGPAAGKTSIAEEMKKNPEIRSLSEDSRYVQLFTIASALEKLNRQSGVHAAGVVISRDPLIEVLPLSTGKNGEVITQYAKEELEKVGLVKFDFLGLKTLTVIDDTLSLIRNNGKEPPDLEALPLNLPEVYQLISTGETTGIFQMESSGFRSLVRRLRPDRFEDIIAVLALYRPGPLKSGMVDQYILRKQGATAFDYFHPDLEPVLSDTYGVIIYQEQVMRIAVVIAGFSLAKADELRKAMGKKNKEAMAKLRVAFVEGALARNHPKDFVESLVSKMEEFAEYGFNKSHSAAYALISYWTAYLKAAFPVEFMAALLSLDKDKPDKMVNYLAECRRMHIPVTVPDINRSHLDFTAVEDRIVFGMAGIRNVGEAAAEALLEERRNNGPYKDFLDFCMRLDTRRANKRVVEWLIRAGSFDRFGQLRTELLGDLEKNLALAQAEQKDRNRGMKSLFGGAAPKGTRRKKATSTPEPQEVPLPRQFKGFMESDVLYMEKDALGFYLTSHPLDRYLGVLPSITTHTTEQAADASDGDIAIVGGCVSGLDERLSKGNRRRWARFDLEDRYGLLRVVAFGEAYEPVRHIIQGKEPILVEGTLQVEQEGETQSVTLRAQRVLPLQAAVEAWTRKVQIDIPVELVESAQIPALLGVMQRHAGACAVEVRLQFPQRGSVLVSLDDNHRVHLGEELLGVFSAFAGRKGVRFQVPSPDQRPTVDLPPPPPLE